MSCRFHKCFRRFDMVTGKGCSESALFKHFPKTCLWQSVISEIHRPWVSIFFSKVLKFDVDFKNVEKFQQNIFTFLDNWIRCCKFQILQREYLSPAVNVLKKSRKISNITNKRGFLSQSYSEIQHNLMKVLSWRFHKCLGPSNMLTVEWCYETRLFRHLFNHAFHNL